MFEVSALWVTVVHPNLRSLRLLCLAAVAAITLLLSCYPSTAHAQTNNLLLNANFEAGNVSYWSKWPASAPGYIYAETCCANHTPNGTWDAVLQPNGQNIVMYQTVSVTPGRKYYLGAWVHTDGLNAALKWWSNANGGITGDCGSNYLTSYKLLSCELTVPYGTTSFNVQLWAYPGNGTWAVTDDWHFAEVPTATTSRYMSTINTSTLYNLGCSTGSANQGGIVVLDFGQPAYWNGNYGTLLLAGGNPFASTTEIEAAAKEFAHGLYNCSPSGPFIVSVKCFL